MTVKGLGPAKRAELVAVLELARRALVQQLTQKPLFNTPQAVRDYLQLQLGARTHEVFAACMKGYVWKPHNRLVWKDLTCAS